MKIDLLKIVENNKKIEEQENVLERKREVRRLISMIIKGDEEFYTNDEGLIKEIGIKVSKKDKDCNDYLWTRFIDTQNHGRIRIRLNKTNIQKIQKYIDKEEN